MPYTPPAPSEPPPGRAASSALFSRLDPGTPHMPSGSRSTSGAPPPRSRTRDKEQTAASLGHSEELSVKHSPRTAIPEFIQALEQASEILATRGRERAGYVLPYDPSRAQLIARPNELPHEAASSLKALPLPGDGERLAGTAAHNDVWYPSVTLENLPIDLRHVPKVRNAGEPVRQNRARKGVDLGERQRLPSEREPRERCGLDAAE